MAAIISLSVCVLCTVAMYVHNINAWIKLYLQPLHLLLSMPHLGRKRKESGKEKTEALVLKGEEGSRTQGARGLNIWISIKS